MKKKTVIFSILFLSILQAVLWAEWVEFNPRISSDLAPDVVEHLNKGELPMYLRYVMQDRLTELIPRDDLPSTFTPVQIRSQLVELLVKMNSDSRVTDGDRDTLFSELSKLLKNEKTRYATVFEIIFRALQETSRSLNSDQFLSILNILLPVNEHNVNNPHEYYDSSYGLICEKWEWLYRHLFETNEEIKGQFPTLITEIWDYGKNHLTDKKLTLFYDLLQIKISRIVMDRDYDATEDYNKVAIYFDDVIRLLKSLNDNRKDIFVRKAEMAKIFSYRRAKLGEMEWVTIQATIRRFLFNESSLDNLSKYTTLRILLKLSDTDVMYNRANLNVACLSMINNFLFQFAEDIKQTPSQVDFVLSHLGLSTFSELKDETDKLRDVYKEFSWADQESDPIDSDTVARFQKHLSELEEKACGYSSDPNSFPERDKVEKRLAVYKEWLLEDAKGIRFDNSEQFRNTSRKLQFELIDSLGRIIQNSLFRDRYRNLDREIINTILIPKLQKSEASLDVEMYNRVSNVIYNRH